MEGSQYSVGEDGIAVEIRGELIFYSENTECSSCGNQSDGVIVAKNDEAPEAAQRGIPSCESCESVTDSMDNETNVDFVEYK
jgi:hypothetical protein